MNNCYICKKKNSLTKHKKINKIQLIKCSECNIIYVQEGELSDTDIKKYYTKKYFNMSHSVEGYASYDSNKIAHKKNSKKLIEIFSKNNSQKKTILDYGCGYGFLLNEARKKNYKVFGIEKSKYARLIAKKNKFKIFSNEKLLINKNIKFDIIFIIGTIEHLLDPEKTLKNLNKLLKKNGTLVITTIDTEGLLPIYKLKPPEHTFYFSFKNLRILLNKCNFEIFQKKTYFANYFIHDLFYRLAMFFNSKIFNFISIIIKKYFVNFHLLIPTNEIIVLAKKRRKSS